MKSDIGEAKNSIKDLITKAESFIPEDLVQNLSPNKFNPDVPDWHDFEHNIWSIGEEIRLLFIRFPSLKKDKDLYNQLIMIAVNRKAKRGRQSFIDLFGRKFCNNYSKEIGSQIDDPFVSGQVILALRKMGANDFTAQVEPFLNSEYAWIKNAAKKYLLKYHNVGV